MNIGATFAAHFLSLDALARHVGQAEHSHVVDTAAARPDAQDASSGDRLGNFEIQRLMSDLNQAETLSSNVQKKLDDAANSQQQKIG